MEKDCPTLHKVISDWKSLGLLSRVRLVDALTPHLTDQTKVGVANPADLMISYRFKTGELKFYGHGWGPGQDLFLVGGKAAWAINVLMGPDGESTSSAVGLPELDGGLTKEEWDRRAGVIKQYVAQFREISIFLTEQDYPTLVGIRDGWRGRPLADRLRLIEAFEPHVDNLTEIGLTNHLGLNIPSRLKRGQLQNVPPFKWVVEQDLFVAAGRATWAVETLMGRIGQSFPVMAADLPEEDREKTAAAIHLAVAAYLAGVKAAAAPAK
ncbi:MAG: hypothetical protein U0871_14705 [Gemmataceae bacterium]